MRAYLLLVLLALATAFTGGYLTVVLANQPLPDPPPRDIAGGVRAFSTATPLWTLDLSDPLRRGRELVDPAALLPQTDKYPPADLASVFSYARTCDESRLPHTLDEGLAKAVAWHRFLCGQGLLANDFFDVGPRIHPAGGSFVARAIESGRFDALQLRAAHAGQLHLLERDDPATAPSRGISRRSLHAISTGAGVALDDRVVLLKSSAGSDGRYLAFPRSRWDAHWRELGLLTIDDPAGVGCVYSEGTVCWRASAATSGSRLRTPTALLLGSTLLSVGIVVAL